MGGVGSGRTPSLRGPCDAQISVRTPTGWLKCAVRSELLTLCEKYARAVGFKDLSELVRARVGDDAAYVKRLARYDKTSVTKLIETKIIKPALRWREECAKRSRE